MRAKLAALVAVLLLLGACAPLPNIGDVDNQDLIAICSFNIRFLGLYKTIDRDDAGLANLLQDFDVVVIQELVAPPVAVTYPDGDTDPSDAEAKEFFDAMSAEGFQYWLSEEDTGTNDAIHQSGSATEWWVAFYKPESVARALDLPHGFLAEDRGDNADYERVPYAFSFRTLDEHLDFILISVHLQPGASTSEEARRKHEIDAVANWINQAESSEADYIILGDMNIEDGTELAAFLPSGFVSLNAACVVTNTNPSTPKPYDQVLYSPSTTTEMDTAYGFHVTNLINEMADSWSSSEPYPGNPYDHERFYQYYSDHNPVSFRMSVLAVDDD